MRVSEHIKEVLGFIRTRAPTGLKSFEMQHLITAGMQRGGAQYAVGMLIQVGMLEKLQRGMYKLKTKLSYTEEEYRKLAAVHRPAYAIEESGTGEPEMERIVDPQEVRSEQARQDRLDCSLRHCKRMKKITIEKLSKSMRCSHSHASKCIHELVEAGHLSKNPMRNGRRKTWMNTGDIMPPPKETFEELPEPEEKKPLVVVAHKEKQEMKKPKYFKHRNAALKKIFSVLDSNRGGLRVSEFQIKAKLTRWQRIRWLKILRGSGVILVSGEPKRMDLRTTISPRVELTEELREFMACNVSLKSGDNASLSESIEMVRDFVSSKEEDTMGALTVKHPETPPPQEKKKTNLPNPREIMKKFGEMKRQIEDLTRVNQELRAELQEFREFCAAFDPDGQ